MGPVFYLVQSHGVRDPISAVALGNWPHEFALAPSPGKKGGTTAADSVCAGFPRPRGPTAEKKSFARNSRHLDGALCCSVLLVTRWWIFCEGSLGK